MDMADLAYFGEEDGNLVKGSEWVLQPGGELITDRKGLVTGRLTFKGRPGYWGSMPRLGSGHPLAPFCEMEKRTVKFEKGWWEVTGEYAGTENVGGDDSSSSSDDSSDSSDDSSDSGDGGEWEFDVPPTYALQPGTGTERIETHPDFVSVIGGTPANPLNGAIFRDGNGNQTSDNQAGMFDRFRVHVGGVKNPWAGLEEYLTIAGTTWTKSWTARAAPGDQAGGGFSQ